MKITIYVYREDETTVEYHQTKSVSDASQIVSACIRNKHWPVDKIEVKISHDDEN